jgi:hypothetical protein
MGKVAAALGEMVCWRHGCEELQASGPSGPWTTIHPLAGRRAGLQCGFCYRALAGSAGGGTSKAVIWQKTAMDKYNNFGPALGLAGTAWRMEEVPFDRERKWLQIRQGFGRVRRFPHSRKRRLLAICDISEHRWRHLNFLQCRGEIVVKLPREGRSGPSIRAVATIDEDDRTRYRARLVAVVEGRHEQTGGACMISEASLEVFRICNLQEPGSASARMVLSGPPLARPQDDHRFFRNASAPPAMSGLRGCPLIRCFRSPQPSDPNHQVQTPRNPQPPTFPRRWLPARRKP